MALSAREMKDRLVYLYDESNKQNLAVFDELLAPDFVSYGGAGFKDLHGNQAFKELYQQFLSTFPDLWFRVDDLVAEGDLCFVRGTLGGTHKGNFMGMAPPTNKEIVWTGMAIFRYRPNGLIDARWQEWDGMSVMQQLGVVPDQSGGAPKPPVPIPPKVSGGKVNTPEQNKALMRRFIDEVWNKGNMAVADEVFHPDATSPSAPTLPTGPAGVRMIAGMFRNAFPDFHMSIERIIADEEKVVAHFTETGTHKNEFLGIAPTNKSFSFGEMGELRIANGQVVESWYEVDMLGLMQQLGVGGGGAAKG